MAYGERRQRVGDVVAAWDLERVGRQQQPLRSYQVLAGRARAQAIVACGGYTEREHGTPAALRERSGNVIVGVQH